MLVNSSAMFAWLTVRGEMQQGQGSGVSPYLQAWGHFIVLLPLKKLSQFYNIFLILGIVFNFSLIVDILYLHRYIEIYE